MKSMVAAERHKESDISSGIGPVWEPNNQVTFSAKKNGISCGGSIKYKLKTILRNCKYFIQL